FGFAAAANSIVEDSAMRRSPIGLLVTFGICLLWMTTVSHAQRPAKIPRIGMLLECVPPFTHGVFHWAVRLMMPTMMRDPHAVTLTPPSEAACRLSWGWRSRLFLTGM
ncbi:MAG TPA: hypothetical protein VJW55_04030, partial [Candidatus Angelobacter sp.]|nr:hypothetical protein [Candidatus Angelobacter sp.]